MHRFTWKHVAGEWARPQLRCRNDRWRRRSRAVPLRPGVARVFLDVSLGQCAVSQLLGITPFPESFFLFHA